MAEISKPTKKKARSKTGAPPKSMVDVLKESFELYQKHNPID